MPKVINQHDLLAILAENLKTPYPGVVNSKEIAKRLSMSLRETCQVIKCLHDRGVVQSDMDGQLSLITRKGMQWLENRQVSL